MSWCNHPLHYQINISAAERGPVPVGSGTNLCCKSVLPYSSKDTANVKHNVHGGRFFQEALSPRFPLLSTQKGATDPFMGFLWLISLPPNEEIFRGAQHPKTPSYNSPESSAPPQTRLSSNPHHLLMVLSGTRVFGEVGHLCNPPSTGDA